MLPSLKWSTSVRQPVHDLSVFHTNEYVSAARVVAQAAGHRNGITGRWRRRPTRIGCACRKTGSKDVHPAVAAQAELHRHCLAGLGAVDAARSGQRPLEAAEADTARRQSGRRSLRLQEPPGSYRRRPLHLSRSASQNQSVRHWSSALPGLRRPIVASLVAQAAEYEPCTYEPPSTTPVTLTCGGVLSSETVVDPEPVFPALSVAVPVTG